MNCEMEGWMGRNSWTRRGFISTVFALCSTRLAAESNQQPVSKLVSVFVEENGALPVGLSHRTFCIGMLMSGSLTDLETKVQKLRTQYHYRTRLRRSSTCKFQLDFALGVLDLFFDSADLRFAARVVPKVPAQPSGAEPNVKELYKYHYKSLLVDNVPRAEQMSVTLGNHSRRGVKDHFLHEYLRSEISQIQTLNVGNIRTNDVLQITSFLAGYVCADHWDPTLGTLTNKVKIRLMENLRARLGVQNLVSSALSTNKKFRVTLAE
jgi:hypothetical protein